MLSEAPTARRQIATESEANSAGPISGRLKMPIKRIADARRIGSIVLRDEEIFQRNLHPRVRNYHHCAREPERSVLCVNVRAYGCVLAAARRFLRRREAATVCGERMVHRPNGLTARAPGGRGCLSLVVHSEHTSSSG